MSFKQRYYLKPAGRVSTMAREADAVLTTLAGRESGVASTKAFTTRLAVLALAPKKGFPVPLIA